jgi:hypothetical protein
MGPRQPTWLPRPLQGAALHAIDLLEGVTGKPGSDGWSACNGAVPRADAAAATDPGRRCVSASPGPLRTLHQTLSLQIISRPAGSTGFVLTQVALDRGAGLWLAESVALIEQGLRGVAGQQRGIHSACHAEHHASAACSSALIIAHTASQWHPVRHMSLRCAREHPSGYP